MAGGKSSKGRGGKSQSLDESKSRTHPHESLIRSLLASIDLVDSVDSAERVYSELLDKVESFVVSDSSDEIDKARRAVLVMCLAIASAFWFTRCNLTGSIEGSTKCSLPFRVSESKELAQWENGAKIQLMSVGSDLLGKFSNLQHLVFARLLLLKLKDLLFESSATETFEIRSISWWLVRVIWTGMTTTVESQHRLILISCGRSSGEKKRLLLI